MLLVLQVKNFFSVLYKYIDMGKSGKNIEKEENYTKKVFTIILSLNQTLKGKLLFGPFVWVSVHHFSLAK